VAVARRPRARSASRRYDFPSVDQDRSLTDAPRCAPFVALAALPSATVTTAWPPLSCRGLPHFMQLQFGGRSDARRMRDFAFWITRERI